MFIVAALVSKQVPQEQIEELISQAYLLNKSQITCGLLDKICMSTPCIGEYSSRSMGAGTQ